MIGALLAAALVLSGCTGTGTPGTTDVASTPSPASINQDTPIKHVVYIINKTGRSITTSAGIRGSMGPTEAGTLRCTDSRCEPGKTVPLKPAPDTQPHDIVHDFQAGLTAINGGQMNGFNFIPGGDGLSGYVQHSRESIPAYWAYADRFVLADHFFSSIYGPTFPEHLFTVAAHSYDIVDNTTTDDAGNCDNQIQVPKFMEGLTEGDIAAIMDPEDRITESPEMLKKIQQYWDETLSCFNIEVLPDQLEEAGISWKYLSNPNMFQNGLQAVRHVRFGEMWNEGRGARGVPA